MKISILGTGVVGQTIAVKLLELGHETYMGSRDAKTAMSKVETNQMTKMSFSEWHRNHRQVKVMDYEELPENTDLFINATNGGGTMDALHRVGKQKLHGKAILDIANPLDFSKGMPPSLFVCNTDSLGERIQSAFPDTFVIKGLNTMNCFLMVNPALVPGEHNVFLSGNDKGAKKQVHLLLNQFGWKDSMIIDLGDITTARGSEMLLPIWLRLWGALGTPAFNFQIARG